MRKERRENAIAPSELLGFDSQMEDAPAVSGTMRSATPSLIGHDHRSRLSYRTCEDNRNKVS